jgi:hypothetical protein
MLVGQLLGENPGRQRAAGQFAAGYCMFVMHKIITPTPVQFMCKPHGDGGAG